MTNNGRPLTPSDNAEFTAFCKEIETDIQNAYIGSVSIQDAELLAAKFLHAMIQIGDALRDADLDSRMRKSGLKALKAGVYLNEASKGDKKPSDVMLNAMVDRDAMVCDSQMAFDRAEVYKLELENYLHVAKEAHIYFRGVAKGRFE